MPARTDCRAGAAYGRGGVADKVRGGGKVRGEDKVRGAGVAWDAGEVREPDAARGEAHDQSRPSQQPRKSLNVT